jgi:hypothetical protein
MSIAVRPASLPRERQELLHILSRNLNELAHGTRFEWLYRDNPAGPGQAWFAYERETGNPVGVASVFPRAIWVGGEPCVCGQVGDFAIDKAHRSLGPAMLLQRATFEPVDRGTLSFCYDCPPHESGMSTFRRLGMEPNCRALRYVRLVRTDRFLRKALPSALVAGPAIVAGNAFLRIAASTRVRAKEAEVGVLEGSFGEEFSHLDARVGGSGGIRSRRNAEDLDWRYRRDPLHQYEVLTARVRGELVAFLVAMYDAEDAHLIDLFGERLPEIGPPLLKLLSERARERGAQTIQAYVACDDGLRSVLERASFHLRSEGPRIVAYARPGGEVHRLLGKAPHWLFQQTDLMA